MFNFFKEWLLGRRTPLNEENLLWQHMQHAHQSVLDCQKREKPSFYTIQEDMYRRMGGRYSADLLAAAMDELQQQGCVLREEHPMPNAVDPQNCHRVRFFATGKPPKAPGKAADPPPPGDSMPPCSGWGTDPAQHSANIW